MIDLLVAGGGPVGLAVAIRARLAGLSVTVVEPRDTPVDKACGEGLMPTAVTALAALGVHPEGVPFRGIRYLRGPHAAEGLFRRGTGLGVRRLVLHAALAERAAAVGVETVTGRVADVGQDGQHVEAAGLRARWLVGADGLHSTVRRAVGLERAARGAVRYGLRRHYALAPWTDLVEVHWSRTAEAYVTPVGPDCVGVALLGGPGRDHAAALADFPALEHRLRRAAPASEVRGAGPLHQVAAAPSLGRVLLVGDAAGYVDALTGEGIALGLAQARAAVAAVTSGDLAGYERAWRRATRRHDLMTRGLLVATRHPALRSRVVPAAARLPHVFSAAVNQLARPA